MSPARLSVLRLLGLFTLAAALGWTGSARADDYGDVNGLLRSGNAAEALARADQYLASKPRDPQMRFLRGVILTEAGRTAEAIETYHSLNQDYPELPEPYNNLAVLYAAQSQFDKARTALEQALRANPAYATAHENLGDVHAKLASLAYNKAQQLDPSNTGVAPKLALIRQLFAPSNPAPASSGAMPPVSGPTSGAQPPSPGS
ncbi:MAG: tetratricopeptide repeat protein [Ramlibacter sp.]